MQKKLVARSNAERTETTRARLISAARVLFVEEGYADTSTPDIAAAAGVTRGALYHHFEDKKALFRAVCEREFAAVAAIIDTAAPEDLPIKRALIEGGEAFLAAMAAPGRTRILLIDGPSVLGLAEIDMISAPHGTRTLQTGIAHAMDDGILPKWLPLEAMTLALSAAYDRAALAIEQGGSVEEHRAALAALIEGLSRLGQP